MGSLVIAGAANTPTRGGAVDKFRNRRKQYPRLLNSRVHRWRRKYFLPRQESDLVFFFNGNTELNEAAYHNVTEQTVDQAAAAPLGNLKRLMVERGCVHSIFSKRIYSLSRHRQSPSSWERKTANHKISNYLNFVFTLKSKSD